MSMKKNNPKSKRARRVRAKIFGTAGRPRLAVFRSLKYISAQVINDEKEQTILAFSSQKIKGQKNDVHAAAKVGAEIARLSLEQKITEIVFDRRGYKYHGKIKALADGARKAGLKF